MPGDRYTQDELLDMSDADLKAARDNGFRKPLVPNANSVPSQPLEHVGMLPQAADPYAAAASAWSSGEYDFRTPSGALCRLRRLPPQDLLRAGILDRINRLQDLAKQQVDRAEGLPPERSAVEAEGEALSKQQLDQLETIIEITDKLVPLAVSKPQIWPQPPESEARVDGRIYVDSIPIGDRVAIMQQALGGLQSLETFRIGA